MATSDTSEKTITYKDFIPFQRAKKDFESLDELIATANVWLESQHNLKVKSCETFNITRAKEIEPSTEIMSYTRRQDNSNESPRYELKFLRCLRIWLTPYQSGKTRQSIKFRVYNPVRDDQIASLDTVLSDMNQDLMADPIQGSIISVETKPILITKLKHLNAIQSNWVESSSQELFNVFVIRVFYLEGTPAYEQIEFTDLYPKLPVTQRGKIDLGNLIFADELNKLLDFWDQDQLFKDTYSAGKKIANVQTVDIKMKMACFKSNRQIMKYTEHAGGNTFYWRIFRFTVLSSQKYTGPIATPLKISYKTFIPVQLTNTYHFESLSDTFIRIEAWLKIVMEKSDINIFHVETLPMRFNKGGEKYFGTEASWTVNKGCSFVNWIYAIRVYFFGTFKEPDPSLLPVVPPILQKGSCNVL